MTNKPQFVGERVRLGDVCDVLNGFAFKSKEYVDEGIRIIRIANVQKGYLEDSKPCFYPTSLIDSIKQFLLEENDLLVSLTGNVGRVALLKKAFLPAALNQRVACLRIKDESRISKRYLYHVLNSSLFESNCVDSANGIAQKNMSTSWLKGYLIPVPPMVEQTAIVRQLDLLQEHIANTRRQLSELDSLVKSRFVEMFDSTRVRVKLGETCQTFNGDRGRNYPSGNDRVDKGVPFINAGHLANGRVSFENMDYITRARYELLSGGKIQKDDILYCLRGSLGKCAIVDFDEGAIASSMMIIRPDSTKILAPFLYWALTSTDTIRQLAAFRNGSSQPNLSAKSVAQYLIPLPPLALQQEFAAFVAQVDKSRFVAQQQIEKLQMLYDSLAQEYFGD